MEQILGSIKQGGWDAVCILGPTASGKTKFAVALARALSAQWKKCEILSADSRQVYRGMDIGTGKDMGEYGEVPVHLVDIVDAGTKYNIFEYQKDFSKAYTSILQKGHFPIICGGSGLYIEAATRGYELYEVLPDEALRASLEPKPMEELVQMLGEDLTPKPKDGALKYGYYYMATDERIQSDDAVPFNWFTVSFLGKKIPGCIEYLKLFGSSALFKAVYPRFADHCTRFFKNTVSFPG